VNKIANFKCFAVALYLQQSAASILQKKRTVVQLNCVY